MSLYVHWLNGIKECSASEWLTDSQKIAFDSIVNNWTEEPFVCLHGATGSGKTFIGHLLQKECGYLYVQDLGFVGEGGHQIVLDGQEYTRLMRPLLQTRGWKRIILLTKKVPRDPMPTVYLNLSDRDIRQFQNVLTRNRIIPTFQCSLNTTDLHEWIRNEAIARGHNHGTN